MYKHRSRPVQPRRPWLALATPIFVVGLTGTSFAFLLPDSSKPQNARVFADGLKIELDKSSPAYAALEDTWMNGNSIGDPKDLEPVSRETLTLIVGTGSAENVAMRILRDNGREKALIAQERAARARSLHLQALARQQRQSPVITASVGAQHSGSGSNLEKVHETDITTLATATVETTTVAPSSLASNGSLQPIHSSNQQNTEVYVHPTRTISLSDLQVSREELASALMLPIATAGANQNQVNMAKAVMIPHAGRKSGPTRRAPGFDAASVGSMDRAARMEPASGEVHRQVVLTGPIEFEGGLALTHALDRIVVYREQDGETIENGSVWIREGRYEIFVEETTGVLVGEMRTPYGDVLGRGLVDLSRVQYVKMDNHKMGPVRMVVSAIPQGVSGMVREAQPQTGLIARQKQLANLPTEVRFRDLPMQARTDTNGRFEEKTLLEGSNVIVQATQHGHWQTIAHARAGIENDLRLFKDEPGSPLSQLIAQSEMREAHKRDSGIVIGRVTRRGASVAGASVEILTTTEVVEPIYFDASMRPDPTLKTTSDSGYYAFLPVQQGAHAVEVKMGHLPTEPRVFVIEPGSVSQLDIEISDEAIAKIKVFDAFKTDWPLSAEIKAPGSIKSTVVERTGEGQVRINKGTDPLILDVDGGVAYERVRLTNDRNRRVVYAPMVQSKWLESIRATIKLNKELRTGVVIGFIQGTLPYRISMEERSVLSSSRIVYFNSRGEVTGSEVGEPGGGFVIFNVPEGMRVVSVQPSSTPKTFVSTILVESNVTNVINHWVR